MDAVCAAAPIPGMTIEQTRRKDKGLSGNGGEFATHNRAEADCQLTIPPAAAELSDVRLGDAGVDAVRALAVGGGHGIITVSRDTHAAAIDAARALAAITGKHIVEVDQASPVDFITGTDGAPGLLEQAHGGILLLTNAAALGPSTLDTLRQPMETGQLTVTRAAATRTFDADFQLFAIVGECPCVTERKSGPCECGPAQKRRTQSRLSGPISVRSSVDLRLTQQQAQVHPVSTAEATAEVEAVRERTERMLDGTGFTDWAKVTPRWLREQNLPAAITAPLDRALERGAITLRGYDRVLRNAWAQAAVDGVTKPGADQIGKALLLRHSA